MNKRILAGIDIGTSKITTIIASVDDDTSPLRVSGVATSLAKGVRKGQIVDIEEATASITESLEASERMAGYSINSAFLSVGGAHVSSQNSHGVVAVADPNKEITPEDVRRAVEAARAISLPATKEILHVIPREFIVDSQEGIKDPVGMTGVRLEVNTHLITVNSTVLRNLEKCASLVGIDVDGFVFGGLSSATAVLTETEKELGVVLVDIGAGTVDLCIFVDGALSYSSVLPFGARNITNDLAIGLKISLESAEKIKMLLNKKSSEFLVDEKQSHVKKEKSKEIDDEIDISSLSLSEGLTKISKRTLIDGIIRPRLTEMFTMIGIEIKKSGLLGMTPSGIVVTGGGAETIGLIDAARRNLAMQVRLGNPQNITGMIDEITTPTFACAVGLVTYASKTSVAGKEKFSSSGIGKLVNQLPVGGIAGKVVDLFKSFLP